MTIQLKIAEYTSLLIIIAVVFFSLDIFKSPKTGIFSVAIRALVVVVIFALFNIATSNIKDNFLFELTPEKYCTGGSYMRTSSPELQAFCSKFSQADIDKYQCSNGFIGRPIQSVMATNGTLSDQNFENNTCSQISSSYNDPQVL